MKKKLNLLIVLLISLFAFNLNVKAEYSFPADGQEHEIKAGGGQGTISNCYAVSDNVIVRYDSATKKCYAKSKTISESGFRASIHLESKGGAYGGFMDKDVDFSITSASGTSDGSSEYISDKEYYANGKYFQVGSELTGGVTGCEVVSGNVTIDKSSVGCKVMANSEEDMTAVLKVTHSAAGAVWTTNVTINLKGNKQVEKGSKQDTSSSFNSEEDVFEICDVNENPKIIAAFKLVGIFISIIKVIVPIIIVVMGMYELSKAVFDGKDDNIKKQLISFMKRSIACLLIFFAPTIILELFHFIDGWDDLESKYSTCVSCILGSTGCPDVSFIDPSGNSSSDYGSSGRSHSSSGSDF